MRKTLSVPSAALGLLVLFSASVLGQESPRTISLPTEWAIGTKYRVEVTRNRTQSAPGKEPTERRSTSVFDVEVVEKNDNGYVFLWKFDPKSMDLSEVNLPSEIDTTGFPDEFRLMIQTDEQGTPESLVNLEELTVVWRGMLNGIRNSLQKEGKDISKAKEFFEMLSGSQIVHNVMIRTPQVYYLACGASLPLGIASEYDDLLPNPFGGDPLPAKGSFLLKDIQDEPGEATIEWKQTWEKEKARLFIEHGARRLLPDISVEEFRKEFDRMEINFEDHAIYVFDTKTGLPKAVEHIRNHQIGPQHKVERTLFKATFSQALPPQN
jgi:hypothetical protein